VLRVGLWSLAVLVVLVVAGGSVVALSFDPDSLKTRIVAAVKQATGRDLTLNGRIRLGQSLQPTLVVQDVAFANPPGFSRPQMATLERLDVKLALIPLLSRRIEIASLVLEKPDIILETDAQGRPNWQFTRESGPPSPQAAAPGTRDATPIRISVADVQIDNGMLTWRDDRTGPSEVFGLTSLRASTVSPQANLHVSMSATSNGAPFTLTGEFGPIARLLERDASDAGRCRRF
jgi:AsmA protein